ncbi:HAD family hydrolase [Aggregicoccus sp. 17bor-14]|uniref:HAD family hydrolase n=1 Tax=Myxococcaceae TaxID=31 RepID=UPI00129C5333|nr:MULTISPECIES: HAD-IA family hydrolase [Myxococcaceae]MBF5041736.1 HAD family hydrolase [Simulacricoccus sp. 17bor-14]MRI87517.1 HAD family hydrolase [Aggregicoccus sp. 17bor-14]
MVAAVIFDVDGTLVDSVDEHAEAWRRAFLEYGQDVPFAHVRSQIGKGADQLLPVFFTEEELGKFGKELEHFRSELFKRDFMPKLRPFPQVRELFEALARDGVKRGLASSAKGDELEFYVKLCGIQDLVDLKTSKDDIEQSKPAPDIFEAAWKKAGSPEKERVVVVGDTPYDAIAATKLQLPALGVLCGGFSASDLRAAGCRALMKDPAEMLARYEAARTRWPWEGAQAEGERSR